MSRFTLTELFGMYVHLPERDDMWVEPKPCRRCGASVYRPDQHRRWHELVEPRRWD